MPITYVAKEINSLNDMYWKRAIFNKIKQGDIIRVTSNIIVSSRGNRIGPGRMAGSSAARVNKGSLGIVADHNIHILSSFYLDDNIGRIENGVKPPSFNPVELGSLLKDTTHIIRISHQVLNDIETLA